MTGMRLLEYVSEPRSAIIRHLEGDGLEVGVVPRTHQFGLEEEHDLGGEERNAVVRRQRHVINRSRDRKVPPILPETGLDFGEEDLYSVPGSIVGEHLMHRQVESLTAPCLDGPLADETGRMWSDLEHGPLGEVVEHSTLVIAGDDDIDVLVLTRHPIHEEIDRPPARDVPRSGEAAYRLESGDEIRNHDVMLSRSNEPVPNALRDRSPRLDSISDADYFANWA